MPKVRSITIDTLTAIQENQFMLDKRKPGHDQWKDYGQEIYEFVIYLQNMGFECILVIGEPGTGKSSGMRTLLHETNIWYNVDNKNPVWTGGKEEYGRKNSPTKYHVLPKYYNDMKAHINAVQTAGGFEDERFAFLLGHIEAYKSGADTRERLKTMGKLANKMQIEGKLESVFYSKVEIDNGNRNYILETQNNGYNTIRSPMGLFEGKIINDYQLILDKLMNY